MSAYSDLAALDLVTRPIDEWPGRLLTDDERQRSPFDSPLTSTIETLERELRHLDAERIVLQLAIVESQIRNDGLPYANARTDHPGVILAFDSTHGPLKYATDTFRTSRFSDKGWQENLRAVALALEALRRVDRYGVTKRGEQYRGWRQLPSGIEQPATHMTTDEALDLLVDATRPPSGEPRFTADGLRGDVQKIRRAYKLAARTLHPDNRDTGSTEAFQQLQAAMNLLKREGLG